MKLTVKDLSDDVLEVRYADRSLFRYIYSDGSPHGWFDGSVQHFSPMYIRCARLTGSRLRTLNQVATPINADCISVARTSPGTTSGVVRPTCPTKATGFETIWAVSIETNTAPALTKAPRLSLRS